MSDSNPSCIFTIFTPTYNRAHTLNRVYDSLAQQTFRDFEWLIVDDGSTDNTRELIEAWRGENLFPIRYFWQKNSGKHIATNRGVRLAHGEFFLNADSDDAFVAHALETFNNYWRSIPEKERPNFSGECALCQTPDGRIVGDLFPAAVFDAIPSEVVYRHRVGGEKWRFVRTEIMQAFPFPEEEHFVTENLVWLPIGKKYKTRFINEPLRIYYMDQPGYMRGNQRVRNPRTGRQEHLYYLNEELPVWWREALPEFLRSAVHYARFSFHLGISLRQQFQALRNGPGRALWGFGLPLAFAVYLRDRIWPVI